MHMGILLLCFYMRKFIVELMLGEIGLIGGLISPIVLKFISASLPE